MLGEIAVLGKILDRVVPQKTARAAAEKALRSAAADPKKSSELQGLIEQLKINQVEAAHKSAFVAGWRPATGWICAVGLGYNVLLAPIISFVAGIPVPSADPGVLYPVLLGMLGLTGARSVEKMKGVSREK